MNTNKEKIHYPYVLDYKPGFFLSWILYKLFKRVQVDENIKDTLRQMQKQGTVVYATKHRVKLDYLIYHYNFRRRRLPYPKIAFDTNIFPLLPLSKLFKVIISQFSSFFRYGRFPNPYQSGFYRNAVLRGIPSLIFLIDPHRFIKQFIHSEKDCVNFLLETQKDTGHPIFIVPQLILYKKSPEKNYSSLMDIFFGFRDNPGLIRKMVYFFRYDHRALIDFGRPLDLKAYLAEQPPERSMADMAIEVRRMLIESIDNQKRLVIGPIMKSRQQLKEIVLRDPKITENIEKTASGDPKKLKKNRKKADEYFNEIAADYSITYIQLCRLFLKWLWKRLFEGIDVDPVGIGKVREWARKGPVVYVPSHKSHIDYLVLNYILYDYHMHTPRIAAGQNLAFWPMGHIFRKFGAFFVRRAFKGARLYVAVFTRYIKALLEDGHPIEFYIEGGRSRNGKLVLPRTTGFLSILLQAHQEGFCKDLIMVPTAIVYDRILEEKSYLKELNGGAKERENILQIFRARHFLKKRYGKIYIRFSEPFSLNEYLFKQEVRENDLHRRLTFHLIRSINNASLVTPLTLVATIILAHHRRGFHASELMMTVDLILAFLRHYEVPTAATLADPVQAVNDTIELLRGWKILDCLEESFGEEEPFYYVEDEKKMELEYYKNCIIHFFIHHALIAVSILSGAEDTKQLDLIISDYIFLKDLFQGEFVFDEDEDIQAKTLSVIGYFVDSGFLTDSRGTEGYKVTKAGFDKLPIWASLAKTFIESYWVTAKAMSQISDGKGKKPDLLKSINYLGRRFFKLGIIEHIGALSQLNFQNAMNFINKNVLNSSGSPERGNKYTSEKMAQFNKKLYDLSHYG
ncbi:MAG: 1-acyl-sn-glycerol-3-phosphate acyltransferase [Deltaproteobacteria bacterium]|nr:1-acyl-sn-glycerol-3-phosphate acyltransferase [Deltaproteobacteria bacterium]